jgi:asparagine synthase (glutamine-hydrolysing)
MAHSTELREPFLDHRLVEYAFSQPLLYKIKEGIQKYMLRDIVREFLTDRISFAPKRPLQTPQREWLAGDLKEQVSQMINEIKYSKFSHWFDITCLEKEWDHYQKGQQDSSFHVWQWMNYTQLVN